MKSIINKILNKLGYQINKFEKPPDDIEYVDNNTTNREKWLEKALMEIPKGSKILDAGAGESLYKKFCTHLDYVSQDFCQYEGTGNNSALQMGKWDTSNIDIVSDITNIPEHDSSFDAIMCVEVFEHIPEPIKAIKEFSRLLKSGGTLIITAPYASLTHFAPYHFYSGFNKYFYKKFLPENLFEIKEITPNGNFFDYISQELRLRIPNQYSFSKISQKEIESLQTILRLLKKMELDDKGSSELLCFGYHVIAIKK